MNQFKIGDRVRFSESAFKRSWKSGWDIGPEVRGRVTSISEPYPDGSRSYGVAWDDGKHRGTPEDPTWNTMWLENAEDREFLEAEDRWRKWFATA